MSYFVLLGTFKETFVTAACFFLCTHFHHVSYDLSCVQGVCVHRCTPVSVVLDGTILQHWY